MTEIVNTLVPLRLENALAAFSFKQIQDAATLIRVLEKSGASTDEFLAYVDEKKKRQFKETEEARKQRIDIERHFPKCPACEAPMVLRPDPDESSGSHWTCPKCRFGRYDPRSIKKIEAEIRQKTEEDSK